MTATATSPEGVPPSGEPKPSFDFNAYLSSARERVEAALDASMGPERPESLRESMRYSLPGRRQAVASDPVSRCL